MSAPDRKMLIDFNNKINALKNKTIENGCTQAEEDSALAKCEELIPKYNNLVDEYYANRNRHKTTVPYSSRIIPKPKDWSARNGRPMAGPTYCSSALLNVE